MPRYRITFYITYPVYGQNEKEGRQAAAELLTEDLKLKGVRPIYAVRELLNCKVEDLGDCEEVQTMEDAETVKKMLKDKEKK